MTKKQRKAQQARRQGQSTKSPDKVNKTSTMISTDVAQDRSSTKDKSQNNQSTPGKERLKWREWLTGFIHNPLINLLGIVLALVITSSSEIFSGCLGSSAQQEDTKSSERAVVSIAKIDVDLDKGVVFLGLQSAGRRCAQEIRTMIGAMRILNGQFKPPLTTGIQKEISYTAAAPICPGGIPYNVSMQLEKYRPDEKLGIEVGAVLLQVYGDVTYEDGVGGNPTLPFCYLYEPATLPLWKTCPIINATTQEEARKKIIETIPKRENQYPPK